MINRASLQAAFDLVEHLQGQGHECIIAGGCARDIFFGVRPKDIDIIVVGTTMANLRATLEKANLSFREFYLYNDGPSDRIIGGFKLNQVPIDVILYHGSCVTHAIDAFDFNLNQFAITGIRHGIEGATVRFVGTEHWGRLVPVRSDCTEERRAKIIEKYLDLVPRRATGEIPMEVSVGGDHGPF